MQHSHLHNPSDKRTEADHRNAVESPPAEGDVAAAVEGKNQQSRAQAGAHAGPVGSAWGPGDPRVADGRDFTDDLPRRAEEHREAIGEGRRGSNPRPGHRYRNSLGRFDDRQDSEDLDRREKLREEKLDLDRRIDVSGAVNQGTGNVVAGK